MLTIFPVSPEIWSGGFRGAEHSWEEPWKRDWRTDLVMNEEWISGRINLRWAIENRKVKKGGKDSLASTQEQVMEPPRARTLVPITPGPEPSL